MWIRLAGCMLCISLLWLAQPGARAATAAPTAAPPEIQQLVELLKKPEVQTWLEQGAPTPAASESATRPTEDGGQNWARAFRLWVAETRSHLAVIRASSRQIPGELARIGRELAVEVREQGPWRIVLLAAGLLVLGYGIQKLYWTMTRGWRKQVLAMPLRDGGAAPVRGRPSPRLQPALAVELRARQPGRTAAVPMATAAQDDPERRVHHHRGGAALGRAGPLPAVAAQPHACAYFRSTTPPPGIGPDGAPFC